MDASERPPSGYPSDSQSWAAGSEPTVATPCYLNKAAQLCLCLFWMDSRARERDVMGRSGYQYYDYAVDRLRHRPGSPRRWPRRDSGRCRAVGGTTGHGSEGRGRSTPCPGRVPRSDGWELRTGDRSASSSSHLACASATVSGYRCMGRGWTRGGDERRFECDADRATRAPVDATRITGSYCERSPA